MRTFSITAKNITKWTNIVETSSLTTLFLSLVLLQIKWKIIMTNYDRGPSIKFVGKIFRKTNISNPLIRTRTSAYRGVRNVSFSENFAYVLNGWPLVNHSSSNFTTLKIRKRFMQLIIQLYFISVCYQCLQIRLVIQL